MPSPSAAEEHLRVIRSLMEKATIYRAISAQAALVAGSIACGVGFLIPKMGSSSNFVWRWFAVLAVSAAVNFYFLHRDARRRGEPFVSAGMRMALRAMWPPLVCGGVVAFIFPAGWIVPFWLMFYGLALLSTVHFAPRSLERLGYVFLSCGLVALAMDTYVRASLILPPDRLMAVTFGLLHIVYAACTWPRTQPVVRAES